MGHSLKSRNVTAINWCARVHELLGYRGVDFITARDSSSEKEIHMPRRRIKGRDTFAKWSLRVLPLFFIILFVLDGAERGASGRTSKLRNLPGDVLRPARSIIAKSCLVFFPEHDHASAKSCATRTTWSHRNLSCSCSYLQVISW